jgi:hypothetical protein
MRVPPKILLMGLDALGAGFARSNLRRSAGHLLSENGV